MHFFVIHNAVINDKKCKIAVHSAFLEGQVSSPTVDVKYLYVETFRVYGRVSVHYVHYATSFRKYRNVYTAS